LLRGAAVDAQNFAYLEPLGPWTSADLERGARRYTTVAAALDHTHVQESEHLTYSALALAFSADC
jgi:hypothetical protein